MKRRTSPPPSTIISKRSKVSYTLVTDKHPPSLQQTSNMATVLPQSMSLQEKLFSSHEDSKYLGGDMDYTYGDNKQKMTTKAEDASTLLKKAPTHLIPVIKDVLRGSSVVWVAVSHVGCGYG